MPTFAYKAIDAKGTSVTGSLEAADRRQVVRKLRARHFRPVTVTQSKRGAAPSASARKKGKVALDESAAEKKPLFKVGFVSRRKLALDFLGKVLELTQSGLPLGDAVRLMSQRISEPNLRELSNDVWRNLSEGRTLAATMQEMPGTFEPSSVHVVEAGEATGNLPPVLRRVVDFMEDSAALRAKVLGSLAYPSFIIFVAFAVVCFFLFFLLPKIKQMISNMGGEINPIAQFLISSSELSITFGPFILGGVFIALFGLLAWRKKPEGLRVTDGLLLRTPFTGRILYFSEIVQSSTLMATLLESGINTTETLRLTEKTIRNVTLREKFAQARQQIQEGAMIANAFKRHELLPDIATDVLAVGENTGNIVNSLREIGRMYRKQLEAKINLMTALISTGALVFAFVLVTLIALSIILSVFSISSSLG